MVTKSTPHINASSKKGNQESPNHLKNKWDPNARARTQPHAPFFFY